MTTVNYTSLLGLALPTTGDLSGTWGNEVNEYISKYVDAAVEGTQTISGSQVSVDLTVANGTALSQAGSTTSGSAQFAIINCTGTPASTLVINAPKTSRQYIVINATSTSQSVTVRGGPTSPTTGVTIPSGQRALVAWNGSDFVQVGASAGGSNTQVQYNSSGALAGSANLTFDGTTLTANDIIDSSLTASKPVFTNGSKNLVSTGTVPVDQGGTGLSTTTAYSVVFTGTTATGNFQASGGPGTSGQVLTSNGAGALPTFQALPASGVSKGQSIAFAMIFGL